MAKKNSREKEAYAKMTPKMFLLYAVITCYNPFSNCIFKFS